MAKKRAKKLTDESLYALIGEAVVEFGRLEDALRTSIVTIVCPAIGYPTNLALFARTRFSELVDLYEFVILHALQHCEDEDKLKTDDKEAITAALKTLKTRLLSVNERRNAIIHSAYLEIEYVNAEEGIPFEVRLEALKPFLSRRALDETQDFHRPAEEVYQDGRRVIADARMVRQDFWTFDHATTLYTNQMWDSFFAWLRDQEGSGVKPSRQSSARSGEGAVI